MDIKHNTEEQYFYIELKNDNEAVFRYRFAKPERVDFYSTYVPDVYRGKGYAAALVAHGYQWAKERNFEIHASCWYARNKIHDMQQ